MNSQIKIHAILERLWVVLAGVIIGVGVCGCNEEGLTEEDTLQPVSLEDKLYKQTKIAFASYRDGNFEIYIMNADGSKQTRLTNNPANDEYPSWSPDGKKIAFQSKRDGNTQVYIINTDGSEETRLTYNPAYDAYDAFPSFSPDGKKIAFASNRDGNMNIYVMDTDGSKQTRLTNNPAWDGCLSWSPDGKKIAFISTRDGNYEIYVMNADGSEQTRRTNNPAVEQAPSWSPDGKKIAFYSLTKDTPEDADNGVEATWWYEINMEIYVMNADGSEPTTLTNNPAYDGYPSWSPFLISEK